jgi:glucosamine 6-phosphate synthetase-like amidotransferase/phosphosugar isomerase protein
MILRNLHEAAYVASKGLEFGEVKFGDIEIIGEDKEIISLIAEFNNGGSVNGKKFIKNIQFIKYLTNKNK